MAKKISAVFISLFMLVGMFFNVNVLKAEEQPGETSSTNRTLSVSLQDNVFTVGTDDSHPFTGNVDKYTLFLASEKWNSNDDINKGHGINLGKNSDTVLSKSTDSVGFIHSGSYYAYLQEEKKADETYDFTKENLGYTLISETPLVIENHINLYTKGTFDLGNSDDTLIIIDLGQVIAGRGPNNNEIDFVLKPNEGNYINFYGIVPVRKSNDSTEYYITKENILNKVPEGIPSGTYTAEVEDNSGKYVLNGTKTFGVTPYSATIAWEGPDHDVTIAYPKTAANVSIELIDLMKENHSETITDMGTDTESGDNHVKTISWANDGDKDGFNKFFQGDFNADHLIIQVKSGTTVIGQLTINNSSPQPGPGPSPHSDNYVPMGTKINGVVDANNQFVDLSITCAKMNTACEPYLNSIKQNGYVGFTDMSQNEKKFFYPGPTDPRSNLTITTITKDNEEYLELTLKKENYPDFSTDVYNPQATFGFAQTPNYIELRQGSECDSYPPMQGCSIIVNENTYEYEVSCPFAVFAQFSANTTVSLSLNNQNNNVYVGLGQGYKVDPTNKKLTFNKTDLEHSSAKINADNYSVILKAVAMNDRTNPGIRLDLTGGNTVPFPDVNNGVVPEGIKVEPLNRYDGETLLGTGLKFSCNVGEECSNYLNQIYTAADEGMQPGEYFQRNSGFVLYLENSPVPHYYPANTNIFRKIVNLETGYTTALEVEPEVIAEQGIPSGAVFSRGRTGAVGYEAIDMPQFNGPNPETVTIEKGANIIDGVTITQNDNYELVITHGSKEYLESIEHIEFESQNSEKGGAFASGGKIEKNGDNWSLTVPLKNLFRTYANVGTGNKTIILSGNSNYAEVKNVNLLHNFLHMPADVRISIIGEGLKIYNTNGINLPFLNTVAKGNDNQLLGEMNTRINFRDPENALAQDEQNFYAPRSSFRFYVKNDDHILVPVTWDDLKALGAVEGTDYLLQLLDTRYGQSHWQDFALSLNPLILAQAAKNATAQHQIDPNKPVYDENKLKEYDALAVTTPEGGLKNVTIIEDSSVNDANVAVIGEVAASITSDNGGGADISDLNYDDSNVEIKVKTEATNITDAKAAQVINSFNSATTITPTDVRFDILISKIYNAASGRPGEVNISELPYEAALEFELPDILPAGQYFHLLREHDGKVEEIELETFMRNNKLWGRAYSKQFSSFVLVTGPKNISPKPAPTPSKKDSTSKSSSKNNTSNVVTCQMAGYPANYAWNEAAKACQPGYLDANGVFRSTARAGVPNTYDKGLKGSVISLVTATVFAFFAAVLLKKY